MQGRISAFLAFVVACLLSGIACAQPRWCGSAKSGTERVVCATQALWAVDGCEDSIFQAKRRQLIGDERKAFDAAERAWMTVRDRCGADIACIRVQYDARMRALDPERSFACVKQLAAAQPSAAPKPGIAHPAAGCGAGVAVHNVARQVQVKGPEARPVPHGGAIEVSWSLPRAANSGAAQVYLVGAMPDGVRFSREKLPEWPAQASFVALPGVARAPFDIAFGAGKTRVLIPINDADVPRQGKLWVKPYIAGPLAIEWAVVAAGPGCSAVEAQRVATLGTYTVQVGAPQVVIQDFIAPDPSSELQTASEALRLQEIELSPDGRFRLDIFQRRYRIFDVATGAKLVERSGTKPRFSPSGRFVAAGIGDPQQTYPTSFDIIDLLAARVVDGAGGPILAWSNGDALLLDGARAYQSVSFINTLVDPVEDENPTRPYFSPGCGTCDGWASSNIRIDWDRLVALRGNASEPEARTTVEQTVALATAAEQTADTLEDRKPLDAYLTRLYGRRDVLLDIGWHSAPQMKLTHVGRGYEGYVDEGDALQPSSPKRPNQTAYLAERRLALADGQVLLPDELNKAAGPVGAQRAAWRSRNARRSDAAEGVSYIDSELAKYGLGREPTQPVAELPIPKEAEDNDDIARPWPAALKAELLAANPQTEPWFGKDEDFARTIAVGAWRFEAHGSGWVLVQHGDPAHTTNGAHQLRFDLVAVSGPQRGTIHSLADLGGLYSQFVGREHTVARPMLARDDRLIVPVPGTGTAVVVKMAENFATAAFAMAEPTLLCGFFTVPGRSLLMQSNCDGQFFVFDARKAKTPILSGRIVDEELILYNAQGYYTATYEGAHFVHIAFPGTGGVHSFEQFARTLQRPDHIKTILEGGPTVFAAPELSPPPALQFSATLRGPGEMAAQIKARSASGLAAVAFYEDGRLFHEARLSGDQADTAVTLSRRPHIRSITAVATDRLGFRSQPVTVDLPRAEPTANRLHVVAIGIDAYDHVSPLHFAKIDAEALSQAARETGSAYYHEVSVTKRYDREATPAAVLDDLRSAAAAATEDDTILVFFAGHGTRTPDGRYFLATTGTDPDDVPRTALNWDDVAGILGRSRGRVIMVLDACHSGQTGEAQGTNDEAVQSIVGRGGAPMVVLAASKGRQYSLEMGGSGGGVFTQSLAAILGPGRTQFDSNRNGVLEVSEVYRSVKEIVTRVTNGQQTPWLVRRNLSGDFPLF